MTDAAQELFALDPDHPGISDRSYFERREALWRVCRNHRLNDLGVPRVDYRDEDDSVWRSVLEHLAPIHRRLACALYLEGLGRLDLSSKRMPQLCELDVRTRAAAKLALVPAEGKLESRDFFRYLAAGRMPCTQYVRHASRKEYTPEPDAVHDILGHVPLLMDPSYARLARLTAAGALEANEQDLAAFERLYWFGIEFGLVYEESHVKIFGAGLLSSFGEMEHALSADVERRPFALDDVVATDYDPARLQPLLFVLSSLAELQEATERLIRERLGPSVLLRVKNQAYRAEPQSGSLGDSRGATGPC
jgi:phenylalanine-4-hydroxylase